MLGWALAVVLRRRAVIMSGLSAPRSRHHSHHEATSMSTTTPAAPSVRRKLSVMMFLEFFIWGAWLPLISDYLSKLGFGNADLAILGVTQKAWILNAFAVASLLGMFFSNQFADRYFAAEKFLAVSHLIGEIGRAHV